VLLPLRTTPSVAEQEGQLIETEATGAPQKHHHTLASPTKGCLIANFATVPLFAPSLAKAKKSAQKILEKNPFLPILPLRAVPISGQWTLTR
jgi:hypothetical protein